MPYCKVGCITTDNTAWKRMHNKTFRPKHSLIQTVDWCRAWWMHRKLRNGSTIQQFNRVACTHTQKKTTGGRSTVFRCLWLTYYWSRGLYVSPSPSQAKSLRFDSRKFFPGAHCISFCQLGENLSHWNFGEWKMTKEGRNLALQKRPEKKAKWGKDS
jgi:hypothetical protein